jgi:transposase
MAIYDKELKDSIIQRMMPPKSESVASLSRETGIPEVTLYKWKKQFNGKDLPTPNHGAKSDRWSTQEKFQIVIETASLSEVELAEYCRNNGLYVEQVQEWKDACMQANGGVAKQATNLQRELRDKNKELKDLNKELKRKEAALAETAALLVLRKKANAIWGDEEN